MFRVMRFDVIVFVRRNVPFLVAIVQRFNEPAATVNLTNRQYSQRVSVDCIAARFTIPVVRGTTRRLEHNFSPGRVSCLSYCQGQVREDKIDWRVCFIQVVSVIVIIRLFSECAAIFRAAAACSRATQRVVP